MGWLTGLTDAADTAAKDADEIGGDIKPLEKMDAPSVPEVPEAKPVETIDKPTESGNPSSGSGVAVAGIGLAGAGILLPSILNSSAVGGAISGAAQVGAAAVLGNDAKDVLNGLVSSITSSPENMVIFGSGVALVIYLLVR